MAGEVAGRAAKAYYDQLLHGDYNAFVAGRYQPDSIPAAYREQLVANAKMFLGQQNPRGQTALFIRGAYASQRDWHSRLLLSLMPVDKNSRPLDDVRITKATVLK